MEIISAKAAQEKMFSVIELRENASIQLVNKKIIAAAENGEDRITLTTDEYKYASNMLGRKGYRTYKDEDNNEVVVSWYGVIK